MATSLIPSRSVLAGGLSGLVAWGLCLAAQSYGLPITESQVTLAVTVLGAVATHFAPDSLKDHAKALNVKVEDLAKLLPEAQGVYPTGKNEPTGTLVASPSNQAWRSNDPR